MAAPSGTREGAGKKIIKHQPVHEGASTSRISLRMRSKGGVKMLTAQFSLELAPLGITINSIAPGAIRHTHQQKVRNDQQK